MLEDAVVAAAEMGGVGEIAPLLLLLLLLLVVFSFLCRRLRTTRDATEDAKSKSRWAIRSIAMMEGDVVGGVGRRLPVTKEERDAEAGSRWDAAETARFITASMPFAFVARAGER